MARWTTKDPNQGRTTRSPVGSKTNTSMHHRSRESPARDDVPLACQFLRSLFDFVRLVHSRLLVFPLCTTDTEAFIYFLERLLPSRITGNEYPLRLHITVFFILTVQANNKLLNYFLSSFSLTPYYSAERVEGIYYQIVWIN